MLYNCCKLITKIGVVCIFLAWKTVHNFHQILKRVHDLKEIKDHYFVASFKTFQDKHGEINHVCLYYVPFPCVWLSSSLQFSSKLCKVAFKKKTTLSSVLLHYKMHAANKLTMLFVFLK